ncbi:hypothetical protein V3481_010684 [Fusarium oxysporum f. sp. vasinfectum]|nr:hypothetical protein QWA68_015732 [Fusarium oxysporum]
MEDESVAKPVPTNPAPAYSNYPTHTTDLNHLSGITAPQPGVLTQQQSLPAQYARTVPQQQELFPPQSVTYPGQQRVVATGMNAAQVVQTPFVRPPCWTAAPIAALGRSPAPVDCPSCGQRGLTVTNFIVGNTTQ